MFAPHFITCTTGCHLLKYIVHDGVELWNLVQKMKSLHFHRMWEINDHHDDPQLTKKTSAPLSKIDITVTRLL